MTRSRSTSDASDSSRWDVYSSIGVVPPLRWSAIVGGVLHNLRSALDTFAYDAMTTRAELNSAGRRHLAFPITDRASAYDAHDWYARDEPVPAVVEAAFRYVQPWRGPVEHGWANPEWRTERHPLTRLARLNRLDKHQTLHLTVCDLDLMSGALPEGANGAWTVMRRGSTRDGAHVGSFSVTGFTSDNQEPIFDGSFMVALDEDSQPPGQMVPVVTRLNELYRAAALAIHEVQWWLENLPAS